jgi:hypothetical protein
MLDASVFQFTFVLTQFGNDCGLVHNLDPTHILPLLKVVHVDRGHQTLTPQISPRRMAAGIGSDQYRFRNCPEELNRLSGG